MLFFCVFVSLIAAACLSAVFVLLKETVFDLVTYILSRFIIELSLHLSQEVSVWFALTLNFMYAIPLLSAFI